MLLSTQTEIIDRQCSDCHSPEHWYPLPQTMRFDHDTETGFRLEFGHLQADCIQCHPGETVEERHQFTNATDRCDACHMDIHFGQFGADCDRCHTAKTWEMTNWRNRHNRTLFPLDGAHAQLNCEACHGNPEIWPSGLLTTDCYTCHKNQYVNALATTINHPENTDCILCHNTRAWVPIDMSHHDRLFPIYSGSHRGTWSSCKECHDDPADYTVFSCGLNGVCHEHRQSEMDDEHRGEVSGYSYDSATCYDCHPHGDEGEGDD